MACASSIDKDFGDPNQLEGFSSVLHSAELECQLLSFSPPGLKSLLNNPAPQLPPWESTHILRQKVALNSKLTYANSNPILLHSLVTSPLIDLRSISSLILFSFSSDPQKDWLQYNTRGKSLQLFFNVMVPSSSLTFLAILSIFTLCIFTSFHLCFHNTLLQTLRKSLNS